MRCIRALGARGLSSILSSPTKVFKRPCQSGLMAFATNEVHLHPADEDLSAGTPATGSMSLLTWPLSKKTLRPAYPRSMEPSMLSHSSTQRIDREG